MIIPLTQGQVAEVDAADHGWLSAWKWHARWSPGTRSYYAARRETIRSASEAKATGLPEQRTVLMARAILGLEPGDPRHGEHANGDTLDNRRLNLRVATASQNQGNRRRQRNNTSGRKGVYWNKQRSKYQAYIKVDGRQRHLGCFDNPQDAAAVYDRAAVKAFGEYARTNAMLNGEPV